MTTCIHSSQSLSPSFLYHTYIPSFKLKDFSFTYNCLLSSFFCWTLHIKFYALRNILPGAIYMYCCLHTCVYVVLSELCYVCSQLSVLQLLIWAIFMHFKKRFPEAICCCLQTCNVDVLLVMYCMYIPALTVTSASYVAIYNILPEAICCNL